jgi:hypothetical protein
MSDPATFQACTFLTTSTTDAGGLRVVSATARWRLAPELPMPGYMTTWDTFGYKTAFNVLDAQTIQSFSYTDASGSQIAMIEDPTQVADVQGALGTQDGYKWVVFVCPNQPPRLPRAYVTLPQDDHAIEFRLKVTLQYQNPNPEVIGVATRLRNGLFANGSMNLLWGIPPAPYVAP